MSDEAKDLIRCLLELYSNWQTDSDTKSWNALEMHKESSFTELEQLVNAENKE